MAFLKKHPIQQISSIPSHQADSPQSTGVFTLGSFHNLHGSSSQLPWTPVDLQLCPRYERLQHGLPMWFSIRSDCHRLDSSILNCFKCVPHPSGWPWMRGSLPELQLPHPWVQAGRLGLLLLSPSSCPFIPFSYEVLYRSGYSFSVLRESCQYSLGLLWELLQFWTFLMHPWREVYPTSTYPSIILCMY